MKPTFNRGKVEKIIKEIFPYSKIKKFTKFKEGLVNLTFRVVITNPQKIIVVKLSKLKHLRRIHQNNQILNYLNKNNIPAPRVFLEKIMDRKIITLMEYCPGNTAHNYYKNNKNLRRNILINAGKNLKKIHSLKTPEFWVHQHHEIKNIYQWKLWTETRIKKYMKFVNKKLPEYSSFLKEEFNKFYKILINKKKLKFVPLHWDYHLSNLNVNSKGEITGIFDFDNAMKGHDLADIGQTAYWIRFRSKNYYYFRYFLKGYKKRFSKDELKLIKGYFLLHLIAVTRTIWYRARLNWIIKEHKKILNEFKNGKI